MSLIISGVFCAGALAADAPTRPFFYAYLSTQPGCQADPSTDLEVVVDGDRASWIVIAPARVVSTGKEPRYAGLGGDPLDLEVAKPLELALQRRIADLKSMEKSAERPGVTRLKIVSVWHGVLGLGMGEAVPQIALRFRICGNEDLPESAVIQEVARNGPKMSSLWHPPRGPELQDGFRKAADQAFNALADVALRSRD